MLRACISRQRQRLARMLLCGTLIGPNAVACHQPGPSDPSNQHHGLAPVDVRNADFATAVHRLMREGKRTPERSALLAGTVRRQLEHAAISFRNGHHKRGSAAVVGALLLVRTGESRADMFGSEGLFALDGALRHFSALGNEGRALAVLDLQRGLLPTNSSRRDELADHQAALSRWMLDLQPPSNMQRLRKLQHVAVSRALLNPSKRSLMAAQKAVNRWVARAVEINLAYQRTRKTPSRQVIVEAYRALQIGSETMAAIHLRHGRAKEAVLALDDGAAGRVADGEFIARLEGAANGDNAEDWRLLATMFRQRAVGNDEAQMDAQLLSAVSWGMALEAFRRDPTSFRIAHALAAHLAAHGMPEAAPLVLHDALGHNPTAVSFSGVMSVIARLLEEHYHLQDAATARRIYASSRRILNVAERARYRTRIQPSVARVRRLMTQIELHAGNADGSRALMVEAMQAEPTMNGYLRLATLERQSGSSEVALNYARRALELPGAAAVPLAVAGAHVLAFEVLRDRGERKPALTELGQALTAVLEDKRRGTLTQRIRAELMLAKIVDAYGEREMATRAIGRAAALTGGSHALVGEVLLTAAALAMVHKDLHAARAALQFGFKWHAAEREMVRAAMWLMLLELELSAPPDGKVDRVLADATEGTSWWNDVARWSRNLATDSDLRSASKEHAGAVRADFYITMRMRARNNGAAAAQEKLRAIAGDTMYWEPEVALSRALLAPRMQAPIPKTTFAF